MFPINQKDTDNGVPGVMYGRYFGDHYAGGNPWILTTGALAQLFYRAAIATANKELASYETIKKFEVLPTDFSIETGELTAKLSVKRKVVNSKYGHIFDAFYAEKF